MSRASVFRIDKFEVPERSLEEFLRRVRRTQEQLDAFDGCVQNHVLQKVSGPGRFNIVTVVEWASSEAIESAQQVMTRRYEEEGFVPGEFMSRLGVDADLANYTALP
jgi:heme-degrading monooxygenase HmoA